MIIKAPKGERLEVSYLDSNGKHEYICTTKISDRSIFFLYKVEKDKLTKIMKSSNPNDFKKITGK